MFEHIQSPPAPPPAPPPPPAPARTTAPDVTLTRDEQDVYLELCRLGTATTAELAQALAVQQEKILQSLAGLHGRRLVRVTGAADRTPWSATAPDVALQRLLSEREQAERDLREDITRLLDGYHRGRDRHDPGRSDPVEVVTGREAIAEVWLSMLAGARQEVAVLDKAPFVADDVVGPELQVLARGVACRAVYERSALLLPGHLAQVQSLMAAGEEALMVPELPFKLAVVDRRWALLPVVSGAELDGALIIRPSPLLDALIHTFETHWTRAMPIPAHPGGPTRGEPGDHPACDTPRPAAPHLLTLLTAGLTDEAIARHLHISPRTVQRRVSELMEELGANNRFQAGVQAVRKGML